MKPHSRNAPFGLAERPLVGAVAVGVAVLGQLVVDRAKGCQRARVVRGDRAADRGEEQRGVEALVDRASAASVRTDARSACRRCRR